ncbi:MAG TPA: hypothetical protein VMV14_08115 [Acidimicrobiales bacterium]|nr:hypothetical protein [Acidimicrobiales bacterium]
MIRRGAWMTAGMVVGVGATVWSQRQAAVLTQRARQGRLPGDVARIIDRGSRRVGTRLRLAVDAGRVEARRRQEELHRQLATTARMPGRQAG